ncbi:hypothetical protein [Clostridium sp. KNHs205]|jgi:hypothetical protein|uniref:hypothetical protein n=1 Tax=Clostridium sp. KNHs205 TaxID=1449050 RepID=UPI00051B86BA|nr:hypothetical protein [Clostridium sp. KNHs205]
MDKKEGIELWKKFKEDSIMRSGLLYWYEFPQNATVLEINPNKGELTSILLSKNLEVACLVKSNKQAEIILRKNNSDHLQCVMRKDLNTVYDYIIAIDPFPYYYTEVDVQEKYHEWKQLLKKEGKLLFVFNNIFSSLSTVGVRNSYNRADSLDSTRKQLSPLFKNIKNYYIFPDYIFAQEIYTDSIRADADVAKTVIPYAANIDESRECLWSNYKKSFYTFEPNIIAGSFLLECSDCMVQELDEVLRVKIASLRGEGSTYTKIKAKYVEKASIINNSSKMSTLQEHMEEIRRRGVNTVDIKIVDGKAIMPRIKEPLLSRVMAEAILKDENLFYTLLDQLYENILKSSDYSMNATGWNEKYGDHNWGIILKKAYPEMTPLNCFYQDNQLIFFDQEYIVRDYPAKYILYRSLEHIRMLSEVSDILWNDIKKKYELEDCWCYFEKEEKCFLNSISESLTAKEFIENFHMANQYEYWDVPRMSVQLIKYLFDEVGNKKIVFYGSEGYFKWFIKGYGKLCEMDFVASDNESVWGNTIEGFKICSIDEINKDKHRTVIMCMDIDDAVKKLKIRGIKDYKIIYREDWD